jgi:hypothetical protein
VGQFGITLRSFVREVPVTLTETAKVRVLPKPEKDEKGRLKPFKPDPKDPDRNLGGVKGKPEDIKQDVWLVAQLGLAAGGKHVASAVIVLGEEEKQP